MHLRAASVLFALTALLSACSPSTPSNTRPPECEAIAELCHGADMGSGAAHDCHEFAESASATAEMCTARQAECMAACAAGDAGHEHDHDQ